MLLTTLMFIPGAVSEVYGCKTLREIGQGSVDHVRRYFFCIYLNKMLVNTIEKKKKKKEIKKKEEKKKKKEKNRYYI